MVQSHLTAFLHLLGVRKTNSNLNIFKTLNAMLSQRQCPEVLMTLSRGDSVDIVSWGSDCHRNTISALWARFQQTRTVSYCP